MGQALIFLDEQCPTYRFVDFIVDSKPKVLLKYIFLPSKHSVSNAT
jgi:hypothetical protein